MRRYASRAARASTIARVSRHETETTLTQVLEGNAHDVQRIAVLELDHVVTPARHGPHESEQEGSVGQVHPGLQRKAKRSAHLPEGDP